MNTSTPHQCEEATIPVLIGESFTKPAGQASSVVTRWLALGAVVGPVLGTLVWIVLGLVRPGYTLSG